MLEELITQNYELQIRSMTLLDSHFGTDIFLLEAEQGKYIVKTVSSGFGDLEAEGGITDFLNENGIPVIRLLKTRMQTYAVKAQGIQFHIQEYIEGKTFSVNTVPDWVLQEGALMLGKINRVLSAYRPLPRVFDEAFFSVTAIQKKKACLQELLLTEKAKNDPQMALEIREQIKHAERLSTYSFDVNRLTYGNSHGDYHVGQIIAGDKGLTVIDWTCASALPLCLDVMMFYTFSAPACRDGAIEFAGLKKFIQRYFEAYMLSAYDLQILPYLFYWHQYLTNFMPPFVDVPASYKGICNLDNRLMNWLYDHADQLSEQLCALANGR